MSLNLALPETLSAPGAASDGVLSRSRRRDFRTSNARYGRRCGRVGTSCRCTTTRPRASPAEYGGAVSDGQAARRS
jgi:hypothetical protein